MLRQKFLPVWHCSIAASAIILVLYTVNTLSPWIMPSPLLSCYCCEPVMWLPLMFSLHPCCCYTPFPVTTAIISQTTLSPQTVAPSLSYYHIHYEIESLAPWRHLDWLAISTTINIFILKQELKTLFLFLICFSNSAQKKNLFTFDMFLNKKPNLVNEL